MLGDAGSCMIGSIRHRFSRTPWGDWDGNRALWVQCVYVVHVKAHCATSQWRPRQVRVTCVVWPPRGV